MGAGPSDAPESFESSLQGAGAEQSESIDQRLDLSKRFKGMDGIPSRGLGLSGKPDLRRKAEIEQHKSAVVCARSVGKRSVLAAEKVEEENIA